MLFNNNKLLPSGPDHLAPVGIGYRFEHHDDLLIQKPDIGWIEVHPENYFSGGKPRHYLEKARELYPLSLHSIGLSLGSTEEVSNLHLQEIKELIDIFEPFNISDHASWSASGNAHLNDLMPLPYTEETLTTICRNIEKTQEFFGRQILVENPSTYISFIENEMNEQDFMNEMAKRTGCKILLDINNIYVQAHNHDNDPYKYIAAINPNYVGELHLAGHMEKRFENSEQTILIDTHGDYVCDGVWDLYAFAISKLGSIPSLIEWDTDIPELSVIVAEAHKARAEIFKQFPISGIKESSST